MAKRLTQKYRKVDSAEVQGEGSFVVFASPTFDDIAKFGDLIFSDNEATKTDAEAIKLVVPLLQRFTVNWDWVDDDGTPLPNPQEDTSVIGRLTFEEQQFLVTNLTAAFNLSGEKVKN